MTEDEAKTKWCPMVRFHVVGAARGTVVGVYANKPLGVTSGEDGMVTMDSPLCIGSACMMWRQTSALTKEGYCGLAGQP